MSKGRCVYCGDPADTMDHVFPSCLYPCSKRDTNLQLLTVPACSKCNEEWSKDEGHFRDVLLSTSELLSLDLSPRRQMGFQRQRKTGHSILLTAGVDGGGCLSEVRHRSAAF